MSKFFLCILMTFSCITFSTTDLHAQYGPTIDHWQDATLDGGLALFNQIMELNGEEALLIGVFLAIAYWAGYDIYCIKLSFTNPNYSTINTYPRNFKMQEFNGGAKYPLDFFLKYHNGKIHYLSSVKIPSKSSIELYGYFFAPQEFTGRYLSAK